MKTKTTISQKAAMLKYQKSSIKQVKFTLNRTIDQDIIEYLESLDNVQGYLKDLVRADMKKGSR